MVVCRPASSEKTSFGVPSWATLRRDRTFFRFIHKGQVGAGVIDRQQCPDVALVGRLRATRFRLACSETLKQIVNLGCFMKHSDLASLFSYNIFF
jgi:hypothetical protein